MLERVSHLTGIDEQVGDSCTEFIAASPVPTWPDPDVLSASAEAAVTLTLVRRSLEDEREVLVGLRADKCSAHRGVMSLPTLRIPRVVLDEILREPDVHRSPVTMWRHRHQENIVVFLVRSVMALKLGLADWVMAESIDFRCRVGSITVGKTDIDDSTDPPLVQELAMMNVICEVLGPIEVPEQNPSCTELRWVPVPDFVAAAELRHASLAHPSWDSIEVCVRGLCITVGLQDLSPITADRA